MKIPVSTLKTKAHKDTQEINEGGCLHMGRMMVVVAGNQMGKGPHTFYFGDIRMYYFSF